MAIPYPAVVHGGRNSILPMDKLGLYMRESYNELVHNVTWPSYSTLQTNTILVLVGSALFALLVFGMDVIWQTIVDFIYGLTTPETTDVG